MGCGYLKLNTEKDGSAKARLLLREDCGRHPTKIRDVILNSNVGSLFNYFSIINKLRNLFFLLQGLCYDDGPPRLP